MSFRKPFEYAAALLSLALILPGPAFKSRTRAPSLTAFAEARGAEQGADGVALPPAGKSIVRELSTGESHSYLITLGAGQYLHAVVEQQGVDAAVTLYEPGGRTTVQLECRGYGPTPVSLVAETSGTYRLEVRSLESEQTRGRYELRAEEVRTATARDAYRVAAEKTFAEAELLLGEGKAESSRLAIDKFTDSLALWKGVGDRREEALTLKRIGDAYQPLGEYRSALSHYLRVLSLSRKIKDRRAEGEALNDLSFVYLTLGDGPKARQLCSQALRLNRATRSRRGEAQALNNFGEIRYGQGELQQSLEFYQQALPLWRESGERAGQALTLLNFGYTYSDLGRVGEAFDAYDQALLLYRAARAPRGQAATLTAVGRLYSRMGESQEALGYFERAKQVTQLIGDPVEEARILNGIAYVYDQLGEVQQAIGYYNQALPLFRAAKYSNGEASTLYDAGRAYHSAGDSQKALDYFQQALSISTADGDRRLQAFELRETGKVYDSLGDKAKALDYYHKSLSFLRAEKDYRAEADTLNPIGRIYEGRGDGRKALEYYEAALPLSRKAEYPYGEAATLHNIARVERDRGNLDDARARAAEALGVVESLREKVASQDLRASYFASVRQQYEFYIDLLMRLHRRNPAAGYDAAAFEASERARARSLIEMLAAARVGVREKVDPELLARERELREELSEKAERRMLLPAGDGEASSLVKEIDELTTQYREVSARVRVAGLEYTRQTQPRPLGLREIRDLTLDDDTLLLEFYLGEERSYLWVVAKDSLQTYELPARRAVEDASNRVRGLLVAPAPVQGESAEARRARASEAEGRYWQEAAGLSETLLGQAAASLGSKRLLIVADGALQYIPLGALPSPSRAGDPVPLLAEHEIVSQPSASALAALRGETPRRETPPKTLAVFADPVFEADDARLSSGRQESSVLSQTRDAGVREALRDVSATPAGQGVPRLVASREEAEAIMRVAPGADNLEAVGFQADKATATSAELGQYRIIHFATHGVVDSERPELSGLLLSRFDSAGRHKEGFLRLDDIYNLNLSADLVVLSACNTGLGKEMKGEGLIGLTRGFMYAGAGAVIASLWKVDDEATAELMGHFYRGLFERGLAPSAALREAQLAMRRQKRWRSPYYWAGFVIQGQYAGLEGLQPRPRTLGAWRLIAWGVAAAAVLFAALYAARRRRRRARDSACAAGV